MKQEHKLARDQLEILSKDIRHKYISGKIKNQLSLLKACGYSDADIVGRLSYYPSELVRSVSFSDVNSFLDDKRIALTTQQFLEENPIHINGHILDYDRTTSEQNEKIVEENNKAKEPWQSYKPATTQKATLYWHQKKAAFELEEGLVVKNTNAQMLLADAGSGKTFILGSLLAKLKESNFHKGKSISPWPYIYVTKASIVEQTKRVLEHYFGLQHPRDILVINIDQLRSKAGELWVDEELIVEGGEEHYVWKWRQMIHPLVIVWDECQILKNSGSTQHKIASAFNDLSDSPTYQIFSSATPFTRVCEAKCFSVATRIKSSYGSLIPTELSNEQWPAFSKMVAHPADPLEHSPSAVDRLMDLLEPYIVRVKGVKPQFKPINKIKMIKFTSKEGEQYYEQAVTRYQEKVAKAHADESLSAQSINVIELVALIQYKIAAESNPDRVKFLCDSMFADVQNGKAAVCAFNYKITGTRIMEQLNKDHGVPRDLVSIIWGGSSGQPTKKQKAKAIIEGDADLIKALQEAGITMADLSLDDVEAKLTKQEFDPAMRMGTQSLKERQNEIDRFQSGQSLYCLYTFRAGGVGLSLHHTDEQTTNKVRHKESGYAFEEDIKTIPTRQRVTYIAPTWSAIEMVQGLGRVPRISSLSDTEQFLVFFSNTVEAKVAAVVSMKLRCLRKVEKKIGEKLLEG